MSENKVEYTVRPTSVISMPVEDWDKLKADTRRAALLEAAKQICYGCEMGKEVEEDGGKYLHKWGTGTFEDYTYCDANEIRKLIERG